MGWRAPDVGYTNVRKQRSLAGHPRKRRQTHFAFFLSPSTTHKTQDRIVGVFVWSVLEGSRAQTGKAVLAAEQNWMASELLLKNKSVA